MKNSVFLKIPSDIKYFKLVRNTAKELSKGIFNSKKELKELVEALKELVENAIIHAYKDSHGEIELGFFIFAYGIRVDVKDMGLPMSGRKQLSVPIDLEEDKGFNRVYALCDSFEYVNLGKDGKKFILIKYAQGMLERKRENLEILFPEREDDIKTEQDATPEKERTIEIREFWEGDEEGISQLIYKNYGFSYIKDIFYFPQQILNFHGKKFYSIVALSKEKKIVGHFAMLKADDSNIAEVGIVVVDPLFKGMGIMDRMFDLAIETAKKTGIDALFGEAIMYHPFSQKSNLKHNFIESALQLGRIPSDVRLNGATVAQSKERGSVLLAFRFLKEQKKSLYIPDIYKEMILSTYNQTDMLKTEYKKNTKKRTRLSALNYIFDPVSNIATIIINSFADDFMRKFHLLLHHMQSKHCHMIYADINLETISEINTVVELLNNELFFYAGIHFLKHRNSDYLQLQYKHSCTIGKKNSVCYSEFSKKLYDYILRDEKRVQDKREKSIKS